MKKIAIIFALIFAFLLVCGCSPKETPPEEPETTASPEASPEASAEPTDSPEASPEPTEKLPDENIKTGYKKELTAVINGTEETVQGVKYASPLAQGVNAPEFELYFDQDKFNTDTADNKFRFTPVAEDASPLSFMEIGYVPDITPTQLMPSFIDSYIDFIDVEFMNYSTFGKNDISSQKITASSFEQYAEAYLVEDGNGTVYCVFSSTEKNDEYIAWFTAMCETISIK